MALWFAVCCFAAAMAAMIAPVDARAQPASTPGAGSEHGALAALPPIVRTVIAEALEREQEQRLKPARGWWEVSFPLPVCLFGNGLCGAVDRGGRVAVEPRYDFVDHFHEGRAVVRSAGLYGYVDTNGKVMVEPKYAMAGRYQLGVAEVDIGGKSALIDLDGRQVLAPRFARAVPFNREVFWVNDGARSFCGVLGSEELHESELHSGVCTSVLVTGRWGLVDKDGRWIREPEIIGIGRFDPANPDVMWARAAAGWGLIRPDGTWLSEPAFEHKHDFRDGLAAVWRDGKLGYVDRTGQIAIPFKFDIGVGWTEFIEGMLAPAKLGRLTGLIDRSGNWVVEPAYDTISPIQSESTGSGPDQEFKGFSAKRGGKYALFDASGNMIIGSMFEDRIEPPARTFAPGYFPRVCADGRITGVIGQKTRFFTRDGKPIEPAEGSLVWPACAAPHLVKVGEKFGYVDTAMRPITSAKFESAGLFRNGFARVKIDGKYGLIRTDGTFALDAVFDAVQFVQGNAALAQVGRAASVIDITTGRLMTGRRFDEACSLGRGVVGVMVAGKMGAIDHQGRWLLEPNYQPWSFNYGEALAPVQRGSKWGFVDWAGHVIKSRFSEVRPFTRGIAWGKIGETWCPIDRRGDRATGIACRSTDPSPHKSRPPEQPVSCQISR